MMNSRFVHRKTLCAFLFVLMVLTGASPAFGAADAGYSEYYIPGDEENMLRIFQEVGAGDQGTLMHAIITVTAWSDNTTVYYDHWETNGYNFDPDDPGSTADETVILAKQGDSVTFEDSNIPANPRGTAEYYDGGDYIYVAGGAATVSRASWTEAEGPNQSLAWEIYPVRPQLTTYILPFGEDLDPPLADFETVYALIQATADDTTITVDYNGDGTPDAIDPTRDEDCSDSVTSVTLDKGEVFLLDDHSICPTTGTLDTGTIVKGSETLQVQYVIGDEGTNFEIRGLSAFPRGFWDDEYYAPVDSGAAATGDPTDIYLHNPHASTLTIDYETTSGAGQFTIAANQTVSFQAETGGYVPDNSAVYLKGSDVFWGVSTIDVGATTHDWGYSLVPAFLLEDEHYMGWAPSSYPITAGYYDDSGIFIAPAQDNIRVFVDVDNDGTADQTFDLDRLETQYVTDSDGDMSDANIWATGPYALSYGQNPDTADTSNPALDVGYTTLPGVGFIELVLTVGTTADPVLVPTAIGSQSTFTIVVNSYSFAVDDISVTDTLPTGWVYAGTTVITMPDKTTKNDNPSISGSELTWDDTVLLDMDENQEIIITFTAQTNQVFSTGDLSRNNVEASGSRTVGTPPNDVTQTFTTSDFAFVSYGDLEIVKTSSGVDPLYPGDQYTYTVTVTNPASSAGTLTGIAIYDPLPEGVGYVAASGLVRGPGYYLDQFQVKSHTNSDGTLDWSGDSWVEYGDGAGEVDKGDIQIKGDVLEVKKADNRIERGADTSGFSELVLSFDYERDKLDDATEYVDCLVCEDWAGNETCNDTGGWTQVARFEGPADDGGTPISAIYDLKNDFGINPSATFAIRFASSIDLRDKVLFDNVQIDGGFDDDTTASNDRPNFVSEGDGYSLSPGQSLQLTFDVTIDDPLASGIEEVTNTASVTTNEILLPLSDSVTNIVVNPSSESADAGGNVWLDTDRDGVQDVGEGGLANVEVMLRDQFGAPVATDVTDSTGRYLFTDVEPGDGYYVELLLVTVTTAQTPLISRLAGLMRMQI